MSENWYFVSGSESKGPVSISELESLFSTGQLNEDTLVWRSGLGVWTNAAQLPEFVPLLAKVPPPLPNPGPPPIKNHLTEHPPLPPIVEDSGVQIRPWPRYWARFLDYGFSGLLLVVMLELFGFPVEDINNVVLGIISASAWIPVEALFLSTWGFTPGKWLLKIRITDANGSQLDFRRALRRAGGVWVTGAALGLPIAGLFTAWFQYNKLKKTGKATYDRGDEFTVHHQNIGEGHLILVGLVFIGFFALMVLGSDAWHRSYTDTLP